MDRELKNFQMNSVHPQDVIHTFETISGWLIIVSKSTFPEVRMPRFIFRPFT
jgi:hypothetical protein